MRPSGDQLTEFPFGPFRLHTRPYRLSRDGLDLEVTSQQAQLLELLLENAGSTVTRHEIRQTLWPADVHIDFDRSINFCITRLRAALGDKAGSPRFIETVPRKGYRFVFPLSERDASQRGPSRRQKSGRRRGLVAGIIGLVILTGLVTASLLPLPRSTDSESASGTGVSPDDHRVSWTACEATALEANLAAEAKEALVRACYQIRGVFPTQVREAVASLELVVALEPDFEPAIAGLARISQSFGDWENAITGADRALDLNPRNLDALLVKAETAFRHHFDWPKAEELFRLVLDLDPSYIPARIGLASLLSAQGRATEAVRMSGETKDLVPLNIQARSEFAEELYLAGRYYEALEEAQRIVSAEWARPEAWLLILHSYLALDQSANALEQANRMLNGFGTGEISQLSQLWEVFLQNHFGSTSDPEQWSEKAFFAHAAGRSEEARDYMQRACTERSGWSLPYFDVDPRFAPLHDKQLKDLKHCLALSFPDHPPRLEKTRESDI